MRLSRLASILFLAMFSVVHAQSRVALVIGNATYEHARFLPNPLNDAALLATTLRGIGFDVTLAKDLDRRGMAVALRQFSTKADKADVAVLFFAGHGLQVGRGNSAENYLVPTDARLLDVRDIEDETIGLSQVLERIDGAHSRIIILDACRDNPLATQMRGMSSTRSVSRGLARIDATSRGTLLVFSTEPGAVASDGDNSAVNSPFSVALARFIPVAGIDVRQALTRVRAEVNRETNGRQTPWSNDGLFEDLFLVPSLAAPHPVAPASPAPADLSQTERDIWAAVHDSNDPRDIEDYLKRFPAGIYTSIARNRLDRLRTSSPAEVKPPADIQRPAEAAPPSRVASIGSPLPKPQPVPRPILPSLAPVLAPPAKPPRAAPVQPAAAPAIDRPVSSSAGIVSCLLPSGDKQPMSRGQCRQSLGVVMP